MEDSEINTNSNKVDLINNSIEDEKDNEKEANEYMDLNSNKSTEKLLHPQKGSKCWAKICISFAVFIIGFSSSIVGGLFIHPAIFSLSGITFLGLFTLFLLVTCLNAFVIVSRNEAVVCQFYGRYLGTIKDEGYFYTKPCAKTYRVSLKSNQYANKIKVNERDGNPIWVGILVRWRVGDTAKAIFDVERFEQFLGATGEAAIRHIGCKYPYEPVQPGELSLRGGHEIINTELKKELEKRIEVSGIIIEEAKVTEVSYGIEIASMMLQKQASNAVVKAKDTIIKAATQAVLESLDSFSKNELKINAEEKADYIIKMMNTLCMDSKTYKIIEHKI